MKLSWRPYQSDDDYWRIRSFLREVFLLNGRHEFSWPLYRFDYWRWHVNENIFHLRLEDVLWLCETGERQIVAVLNPDNAGDSFLQVHPDFAGAVVNQELLSVAETHLAETQLNGKRRLCLWVNEHDSALQTLVARAGYIKGPGPEYQRRRPLSDPILSVPLPEGYTLRALGTEAELPARSYLSWQAFHPNEPEEKYEGWEWYLNVQRAPLYRRDLDLVAVAPDGELAAFCTIWFDDVTRTAAFEPVGTAPKHQRRGLGRAVMTEGLRRAVRLGATLATVGSFSAEAGALYASVGFTDYDQAYPWTREWEP